MLLSVLCGATAGSGKVPDAAAGVAYDEIARLIAPGATPPPLDSFDADAAVIAALPPLVLPREGPINTTAITLLAVVPYVGAWLAKAAEVAAVSAHEAQLKKQNDEFATGKAVRQRTGVLVRFAFYRGWSRVDVSPAFTRIDKPDQGLTMMVDNATKTYRSVHTKPDIDTYTVQSGQAAMAVPVVVKAPAVEPLPAVRIGGISARGYRTTGSISVTRATFLCAAGEHRVTETEYVGDFADPKYDANRDSSNIQPLVTACALGNATSHREPGRLVFYRVVTVDEGTPTAFSVALERGNIHAIGEQDSALFAVPADFKEAVSP